MKNDIIAPGSLPPKVLPSVTVSATDSPSIIP